MGKFENCELCRCAQNKGCDLVFYDKYAQLCKQRGVSMSAAAAEAGFSKSLVTKWKVNKVEDPSPEILKKLSVYFNIPVSELLNEKENPATNGDEVKIAASKYDLLNDANKAFIDEMIDKLIKAQSAD
jgi:transcriptional regulator with XRE-family HTH domain